MSRGPGSETPRVDRAGVMTPSHSGRSVSTSNSHNPHRTSYQMQLAQGHHRDRDDEQRERAHHRQSRQSVIASPTPSPRFGGRPPTPTSSFRRPSSSQNHHYDDHETFYEAQYSSQQLERLRRHTPPLRREYDEPAFPPNSQRPAGPFSRHHYNGSNQRTQTYTPIDPTPPPPSQPPKKAGSKATVEIFNKLLQLEHDVGDLRNEVLHIRDSNHDLKTSLRAMPTREEMREELRDILTSTLQETTASLTTSLSTSLTAGISESVKQSIGDQVTEAVEKATRSSTQSLPAITAHLVCEKTKVALGSTEKKIEDSMRTTLKSVPPQAFAPPGGTMANLLRPINEMKAAFEDSGIAQSMRFVAGVTDQLNEKLTQLQTTTLNAVQSQTGDAPYAALIHDGLSSIEKRIEAVNTSLAALSKEALGSEEFGRSLRLVQSDLDEIKTNTGKLGPVEQRLGDIAEEGKRTASQHSSALQQMIPSFETLVTSCGGISKIGEQLHALETNLNSRHSGDHVLAAEIRQDLAALKENTALLGTVSERLDRLNASIGSVQEQCRGHGSQLERLYGIEKDLKSVEEGGAVLQQMDQRLTNISATLGKGEDRLAPPTQVDLNTLKRLLDMARVPESIRPLDSPSVMMVRPVLQRNVVRVPPQAGTGTWGSNPTRSQISVIPSPPAEPARGHTHPLSDTLESSSLSPDSTHTTDQAFHRHPSADTNLHLLSVVASQASTGDVQGTTSAHTATSSDIPNSVGARSTPSATSAASADPTFTAVPPSTSAAPSASASVTATASTPSSSSASASTAPSGTASASTAPSGSTPASASFSVGVEAPTTRPKPSKRNRQKWKNARLGSRRSSRIQAQAEARDEEEQQPQATASTGRTSRFGRSRATASRHGVEQAPSPSSAQAERTPTEARTIPRLTLWFTGRKRRAQSEPEARPTKRATNSSLSGYYDSAGHDPSSGNRGPSMNGKGGGEEGQGSRSNMGRVWGWWQS